jgi:BirA family biotin operon repressor/biotin-[acetyl-CoA-carboxylase] ligase
LPFVELQSVDSTNNYARQQIHAELSQHGLAVFAHEQVAGKGQRGKAWVSEKGSNIALSVIFNPQSLALSQQFQLSACVAVALQQFFSRYAGDDTKIKWPNDLYWQDKKAGGILIESVVSSGQAAVSNQQSTTGGQQWQWAVVGMGININQTSFSPELPNPVSLKQITGKNFDPLALAKELCTVLDEKYSSLINNGFAGIYEQYTRHLYKRNELVKFRKDNRLFEAVVKTVLPSGRLVVQHALEEEFDFGEAEWMI